MSSDYTFDLLGPEAQPDAPPRPGATRGDFLRRLVTGGGALLVGGAAVAEFAPMAQAKTTKTDITVLNAALVLENLGEQFYTQARRHTHLERNTKAFVNIVHDHEVKHVAFVKAALGRDAKKVPEFNFGEYPYGEYNVQRFAATIENLCTEALVGVAPIITRSLLAKAGVLLPVESMHSAWINYIIKETPAPAPFNPAGTLPEAEQAIAPYIRS